VSRGTILALVLTSATLARALSAQAPALPAAAAAAPPGFDRAAAQRDTRALLDALIALDTQNPPGNEILVARHLDTFLRGVPGIETRVLDPGDGRANFVARLRATKPSKRAVLIMGHMDVVGADASKWSSPPFAATERDGYLYGRGAIDDKGPLAATAIAMRMLAPLRDALDRDVILLGTAAEEGGDQGMARVLASHFDLIKDAEFALNEGGRVRMRGGRIYAVNVQVTEKLSYTVDVRARGTSGHGSVPLPDNAIAALSRALGRVHAWKPPVRVTATTREYFAKLARVEPDAAMRQAMIELTTATDQSAIDRAADVLSRDPVHSANLRTGVSVTMIDGGIRTNVIPSEATAALNVRILPDGDIAADVATLNRVGAEPQVTFSLRGRVQTAPPASASSTELFKAMETAATAMVPGVVVIPFMSNGATDGAALRAAGIPTYGLLPLPLEMDDELRMHGDNERVPVSSLGWGAEYLYRVLLAVARR
jgi:acetylornithine deacetylase/succinyl-diaminopimelate desuccinylase-like protein